MTYATLSAFEGNVVVILFSGRKSVTPATKLRIFETTLRVKDIGLEGKAKPNNAQTANTKNMAAKENKVYFDIFVNDDHVRRAKLEICQASRG